MSSCELVVHGEDARFSDTKPEPANETADAPAISFNGSWITDITLGDNWESMMLNSPEMTHFS